MRGVTLSIEIEETVYFLEAGPKNTDEVLRIAKEKADELGINSVVVASTSGETGVKASKVFKGRNLVVVTLQTGWRSIGETRPLDVRGPNVQPLTEENREKIIENGGRILTCVSPFGGVGEAVRRKFDTVHIGEVIADSLRIFGHGLKVACEVTLMAADAGLVRVDEDVISIGGTTRGADTAILIRPDNSFHFFNLKVKEILCRPRL